MIFAIYSFDGRNDRRPNISTLRETHSLLGVPKNAIAIWSNVRRNWHDNFISRWNIFDAIFLNDKEIFIYDFLRLTDERFF